MASRVEITAEPRTVLGKKVKRLRAGGYLPANVYGRGVESKPIQLEYREFMRVLKAHGVRQMFDLKVDGESEPRFVLIRAIDRRGGTGDLIHADFYQVALDREITTRVVIELTGESEAVRDHGGTLIQNVEYVTVRCLPTNIPDAFTADLSVLETFDAAIHVSDLQAPPGVSIEDDPSNLVATVAPPRILTAAEEEEEAALLEGEEGEAEEGAEGEEGEAPSEEGEDAEDSGQE